MISLVDGKSYTVKAEVSILGDESKSVKEQVKETIFDKKNHTETCGLRLSVNFKVNGRYFIPVNVDLTDGQHYLGQTLLRI